MTIPDDRRCTAHNRAGNRCGLRVVDGRRVCRLHGGLSPRGAASATFKHGKYSRFLPARLADRYAEAENDPTLLSLSAEASLVQVRITELAERLHGRESGSLWSQLKAAWNSFQEAGAAKNTADAQVALAEIGRLISDGDSDEQQWAELIHAANQKAGLVVRENARLRDIEQQLSVEDALTLLGAVAAAVREIVPDSRMQQAIALRLEELITRSPLAEMSRIESRGGESIDGVIVEPTPAPAECEQVTASDAALKVENSNGETLSIEQPHDHART